MQQQRRRHAVWFLRYNVSARVHLLCQRNTHVCSRSTITYLSQYAGHRPSWQEMFGVTKQFAGTGSNKSAKRRRVRPYSYVWNQHFPTLLTIIASMYPGISNWALNGGSPLLLTWRIKLLVIFLVAIDASKSEIVVPGWAAWVCR